MTRPKWIKLLIALSVLGIAFLGTAAAQKSTPRPQDRLSMGEENVKQLISLMPTDESGNVSKETYMKFMEAEFHRLDKSNQGHLNAGLLTQTQLSASRFAGK
jgi:hypothetical protein